VRVQTALTTTTLPQDRQVNANIWEKPGSRLTEPQYGHRSDATSSLSCISSSVRRRSAAFTVWMIAPHCRRCPRDPRARTATAVRSTQGRQNQNVEGRIVADSLTLVYCPSKCASSQTCNLRARIAMPLTFDTGDRSMPDPLLLHCPSCGATNRVAVERIGAGGQPVCGRCKSPLQVPDISRPIDVTDANFASEIESAPLWLLPVP
jgi:hypothetical protein